MGCAGAYDNVNSSDVVVFLMDYEHAGHTYRLIENLRLNQCLKTCRDDDKCVGFFYSALQSRCELKDSGGVNFEQSIEKGIELEKSPLPVFAGVKLLD